MPVSTTVNGPPAPAPFSGLDRDDTAPAAPGKAGWKDWNRGNYGTVMICAVMPAATSKVTCAPTACVVETTGPITVTPSVPMVA